MTWGSGVPDAAHWKDTEGPGRKVRSVKVSWKDGAVSVGKMQVRNFYFF